MKNNNSQHIVSFYYVQEFLYAFLLPFTFRIVLELQKKLQRLPIFLSSTSGFYFRLCINMIFVTNDGSILIYYY